MRDLSIYIHIPFCQSKCSYCDFNSFTGSSIEIDEYLNSLEREISHMSNLMSAYHIKSIFIGGGTPTILNTSQLEKLLSSIQSNININSKVEFTIECNPDSLTYYKLALMQKFGVNRLSIGLQSTIDKELQLLGRIHDYNKFLKAYRIARSVGFDNINVDLMFAFPTQTITTLETSLNHVINLNPEHISCYSLIVENGTQLEKKILHNNLIEIDDNTYISMYELVINKLKLAGYEQYEISNFAKNKKYSTHNIGYWTHREYVGFGLEAHSYFKNFRFENTAIISVYKDKLSNNKLPRQNITIINKVDFLEEEVMLKIRMNDGIILEDYFRLVKAAYPNISDLEMNKIKNTISKLKSHNLLVDVDDKIKLTAQGRQVSSKVILDLIPMVI